MTKVKTRRLPALRAHSSTGAFKLHQQNWSGVQKSRIKVRKKSENSQAEGAPLWQQFPQLQEGGSVSHENAAIIQSIYPAFAEGDVATVMGHMSPDIAWNEAEIHPYSESKRFWLPMIWSWLWVDITAPTKQRAINKIPKWSMRGASRAARPPVSNNIPTLCRSRA